MFHCVKHGCDVAEMWVMSSYSYSLHCVPPLNLRSLEYCQKQHYASLTLDIYPVDWLCTGLLLARIKSGKNMNAWRFNITFIVFCLHMARLWSYLTANSCKNADAVLNNNHSITDACFWPDNSSCRGDNSWVSSILRLTGFMDMLFQYQISDVTIYLNSKCWVHFIK